MVNNIRTLLVIAFLSGLPMVSFGQDDVFQETFFSSGKMPVFISVIGIILLGFFIYLFILDRKVSRLENQLKK